jgi:hypothetical protein
MKKSIAMKWAKALRSGKYKQGRDLLRSHKENTYCCLGVLCAIGEAPASPILGSVLSDRDEVELFRHHRRSFDIPGLGSTPKMLADLNDHHGATFDEIADLIEACWEEL